jgi:hypothetical protein
MGLMMSDAGEGRLTTSEVNAMCNAGGKMIRMVELNYKYGKQGDNGGGRRTLNLIPGGIGKKNDQ